MKVTTGKARVLKAVVCEMGAGKEMNEQIEAKKGVDYHTIDRPLDPSPETIDDEAPRSRIGQYILGGCIAAIAIALATSVLAETPVGIISDGSYVEMVGSDVGYVIEFHNQYESTRNAGPFNLVFEGVETLVYTALQNGEQPDEVYVIPPPGFYCDPCFVVVPEGQVGQIFLYPMGLSWDISNTIKGLS